MIAGMLALALLALLVGLFSVLVAFRLGYTVGKERGRDETVRIWLMTVDHGTPCDGVPDDPW